MSESTTKKIMIGVTISVLSAILIAIFIPKEKPSELPRPKPISAELISLQEPRGIFSLKYPRTLSGVSFRGTSAWIGTAPPEKNESLFRYMIRDNFEFLRDPQYMAVIVIRKEMLDEDTASSFWGKLDESREKLVSLEDGFTTKESRFVVKSNGTDFALLLIDYSSQSFILLANALVKEDEWKANEAVWRASFKSLKLNADNAERALGAMAPAPKSE